MSDHPLAGVPHPTGSFPLQTGKRILHIINDLDQGGAEAMLYNLLRSSTRYGHLVVSLKPGGRFRSLLKARGIPVATFNFFHPPSLPAAFRRLLRFVSACRPDVIQSWMYISNAVAWILSRLVRRRPVLVWNVRHSLTERRREKALTRLTILCNRIMSSRVPAIIYNSAVSAAQHERAGFGRHATRVIHNGIDCDRFDFDPEARDRRRRLLAVENGCCLIGVIGRFHPLKDHANFLAAAALLQKDIPDESWKCVLIGRRMNRGNAALAGLVRRAGVAERVILVDETPEIPAYLCAIDVFCSPSRSESFPNVVAEAMAAGVPCVATAVGETAHLVGDTGFLVPPRNPRALADGLAQLIRAFASGGPRRSPAARARIEALFSLPRIARQYEELYAALLAQAAAAAGRSRLPVLR